MNETKKIKFPVAAIFCTANVLLELISIFMTYASLPHMPWNRLLNTLLFPILSLISGIVLAVVLYQRKRRLTLFLALGLELVIPLLCICDIVFSRSLWGPAWKDLLLGQAIAAVIALLLLLFAAFQDWKEKSGIAKFNRAIWFVPGILYLVNNLSNLHQGYLAIINHAPDHDRYMLSMFSILAVGLPMTFLLGWWLTHPYKKERAVYQMPVAQPYGQPYGQPVYQSAGASNAAQKVFCTNCGRELLPDETFCVNCGTRRPELPRANPDQAEQKVFCTGCGRELPPDEDFCGACGKERPTPAASAQPTFHQPVYTQMGYVQDAPSGGMTALGFFFPIVGLILYLVWKDQTPLKAHSAGKGALIGVIVWTALSIILAILAYVIPLLVFYSYY